MSHRALRRFMRVQHGSLNNADITAIGGFAMNRKASVIALGAVAALWLTAPLASQRSGDAQLEAACRATEVSVPASCPCTLIKARATGLSDAELASLFKDDGHSQPVAQARYATFWQVKVQCIADASMAQMGVTPGNPLPGVPAHMRPGMPLPGPAPAPAPAPARAASQCDGDGFGGSDDVIECGRMGIPRATLIYHRSLAQYPQLLAELKRRSDATFSQVSRSMTDRYSYIVSWSLASANGNLISVTGADGDTSRGRLGGSTSLLWDTEQARMIAWQDVFGAGLWNGRIQRDYCTALRARFAEMQAQGGEPFRQCPSLDALTVALIERPSGERALSFSAAPGVITGYATSALYDGIELPLDAALLSGVQAPYRAALGGSAQTAAVTPRLVDRLGTVILGPPHFAQAPECVNEYHLQPERIGNPRSIADIRALIERSPGLVMVTGAGMLGSDDWRSGVVLDGRFVDMTEGPWDERLKRSAFTGGGMAIHYEARQSWAEVSYGGWGHGDLVVRAEGETTRIPVLQQMWQCT